MGLKNLALIVACVGVLVFFLAPNENKNPLSALSGLNGFLSVFGIIIGMILITSAASPLIDPILARWRGYRETRATETLQHVGRHEAGHALMVWLHPETVAINHATTVLSEDAGGHIRYDFVSKDAYRTKMQLRLSIKILLASRIAEEMFYGEAADGVQHDLEVATDTATDMVQDYGMGQTIGLVSYSEDVATEETDQALLDEVKALLDECYAEAKAELAPHKAAIEKLGDELVKRRTMNGEEVLDLLGPPPAVPASAVCR